MRERLSDRDHAVLFGITRLLAKAWRRAKRSRWRWSQGTWADTVEADLLRQALGLLAAEEAARDATQRAPGPRYERVSAEERQDLEHFLLHQARTQLYGLNLKRKRRDYA